jgi:hypothetical protein
LSGLELPKRIAVATVNQEQYTDIRYRIETGGMILVADQEQTVCVTVYCVVFPSSVDFVCKFVFAPTQRGATVFLFHGNFQISPNCTFTFYINLPSIKARFI